MGMFNYVKYTADCIKCGKQLKNNWQTKSSEKELICEIIYPQECDNFYDVCPKCKTWNEYKVIDKNTCKVELVPEEELPEYKQIKDNEPIH